MVENQEINTRQGRRKAELQKRDAAKVEERAEQAQKEERKPRNRLIPIWMRLLIVVILVTGSLLVGLMVGYGVIGSGDPADALKTSTWEKLLDLVRQGT